MLRLFLSILFIGVLSVTAYVPSTYAASTNVVLTHIQAGGVGAATQEFIVLYNNSELEVDISGWCLTNKNNVTISCLDVAVGQAVYLPARAYAVVASTSYASLHPAVSFASVYVPVSQSSGSMTGSADTVSLIDHLGNLVDRHSWTSSITGGMQFVRRSSGVETIMYQDSDDGHDWDVLSILVLPANGTEIDTTVVDMCPNIEGDQLLLPVGKELNTAGECIDRIIVALSIMELLPNADGPDAGQEFIELYNPNDFPVNLANYVLYVGAQYEDHYLFPVDTIIQAHSYKSFSNSALPFTLLNSSSRVALALKDGTIISEPPQYHDPKDGQSWAFINETWQYTTVPTPDAENVVSLDAVIAEIEALLKPCVANQYRSLETNRCRLITSTTGSVAACKDGQYRSEETNRCRNIANEVKVVVPCDEGEERNSETGRCRKIVTAVGPAPCKEGQERNLETNRCRTVTKMSSAGYGVLGAETKSSGNWYVFAAVGGILLLAVGYAIWEWHDEIGKFLRRYYIRVVRFVRSGK